MGIDYEKAAEQLSIRFGLLHETAPGSIGDAFHMELVGFLPETGDYLMTCDTQPWMQNPIGMLHGGIISTILDQAMGMLAHCVLPPDGFAPSIQLNTCYIRPIQLERKLLLKIRFDSVTKTLIHMRGEICHQDAPEKLCATATGIYYHKPQK